VGVVAKLPRNVKSYQRFTASPRRIKQPSLVVVRGAPLLALAVLDALAFF